MKMDFNLDGFLRGLDFSKAEVQAGAVTGMGDATDDLLQKSVDMAPLDKGTLRRSAGKEITVSSTGVTGEVWYSVAERSGSVEIVNYALIQHEMSGYKNPTTPGTQPKFLEKPLKANASRYKTLLASAIREALK